MLHGHISRDEQSAARLFQEAQAANRIHHPGIVAISAAARSELFAAASPRA